MKKQHILKMLRHSALRIPHCALCIGLLGLSGCGDFLELEPLNDIVFENYWTEKADVQSVVYSCYSGLTENDCMNRMFVWGEVRSDNISRGASTGGGLQQALRENIMVTGEFTKWASFYQVINRCNTVIQFAPTVAERDPNYTDGDLKANIAEVTAIRALCYFYLIRAFRDVPYVTSPSSDDSDIDAHYRVAATPFREILESLIADLENVRNDAVTQYPEEVYPVYDDMNSGRITKCGIDALLCDLYLWHGDYAKCMEAADRVLAFKRMRYEEMREEDSDLMDVELFNDLYPLIPEQVQGTTAGNAYGKIFGTGHSFESIFELGFINNYGNDNKMIGNYFGSSSTSQGELFCSETTASGVYDGGGNDVWTYDDCRYAENIEMPSEGTYLIRKYVNRLCDVQIGTEQNKTAKVASSMRTTNDANWIIYRLTDVMLMKAEAAVELTAQTGVDSLDVAFELVQAVNRRGRNLSEADKKNLQRADYSGVDIMRELVQAERRRELMFEGKRWFDLVRVALREGDNTNLINQVIKKHTENTNVIRIKLHTQDALFWPINRTELDVNPRLHQNPAYQSDDDVE